MASFDVKVVLLGSHGSGKSCLLHSYITGEWRQGLRPTYGTAFAARRIPLSDGSSLTAGFWDTSGSPAFHGLSRRFIRGAHVAIGCFDITSRSSWERVKVWMREARDEQPDIRLILAATKVDLLAPPPAGRVHSVRFSERPEIAGEGALAARAAPFPYLKEDGAVDPAGSEPTADPQPTTPRPAAAAPAPLAPASPELPPASPTVPATPPPSAESSGCPISGPVAAPVIHAAHRHVDTEPADRAGLLQSRHSEPIPSLAGTLGGGERSPRGRTPPLTPPVAEAGVARGTGEDRGAEEAVPELGVLGGPPRPAADAAARPATVPAPAGNSFAPTSSGALFAPGHHPEVERGGLSRARPFTAPAAVGLSEIESSVDTASTRLAASSGTDKSPADAASTLQSTLEAVSGPVHTMRAARGPDAPTDVPARPGEQTLAGVLDVAGGPAAGENGPGASGAGREARRDGATPPPPSSGGGGGGVAEAPRAVAPRAAAPPAPRAAAAPEAPAAAPPASPYASEAAPAAPRAPAAAAEAAFLARQAHATSSPIISPRGSGVSPATTTVSDFAAPPPPRRPNPPPAPVTAVSESELTRHAALCGALLIKVSSRTGRGVQELFEAAAEPAVRDALREHEDARVSLATLAGEGAGAGRRRDRARRPRAGTEDVTPTESRQPSPRRAASTPTRVPTRKLPELQRAESSKPKEDAKGGCRVS